MACHALKSHNLNCPRPAAASGGADCNQNSEHRRLSGFKDSIIWLGSLNVFKWLIHYLVFSLGSILLLYCRLNDWKSLELALWWTKSSEDDCWLSIITLIHFNFRSFSPTRSPTTSPCVRSSSSSYSPLSKEEADEILDRYKLIIFSKLLS